MHNKCLGLYGNLSGEKNPIETLHILIRGDYMAISNSNGTERSTFEGEIARVISQSDEREERSRFEITRSNY